jgi:hypothetical protein
VSDVRHLFTSALVLAALQATATQALANEASDSPAIESDMESSFGELFGSFSLELRYFPRAPLFADQPRHVSTSLAFEPEYSLNLEPRLVARAVGFIRLDDSDPERSHADAREARLEWRLGAWTLNLGFHQIFWGVTESRHLVDIVNQDDFVEDIDGEENLGQLMEMLSYSHPGAGLFDVFLMTWFRPRIFPGLGGRPRLPLPVLSNDPTYESNLRRWQPDVALRWSHHLGQFDWALSYFYGTSREPELVPVLGANGPALQPRYDLIHQGGLELQWTTASWLWKLEAITRSGQGPAFVAATGGFEYVVSSVLGSNVDAGPVVEYSYDGRENQTFNVFDHDIFGGIRVALNDDSDTQTLAGALTDVESGAVFGAVEASRRLGDNWKLALDGRFFVSDDPSEPHYYFRRDHYLQLDLQYRY